MPKPSADFDCDNATLFMQDRLSELGIESTPVGGNMTASAESFNDITHVWLIANVGGIHIPFDWGTLRLDSRYQHQMT